MHEQIGIAADRRGEVGVLLERQAEVADVGLLIHRFAANGSQTLEQQSVRRRSQRSPQLSGDESIHSNN